MERHDRLLPLPALAGGVAAALGLGLDPRRAHPFHTDAEDVLDRLADLGLVGALVDAERVLVGRQQRIALLGDHGPEDHLARVHAVTAIAVRRSRAGSETTRRAAPTTSAIPERSTWSTSTSGMLRNERAAVSSPSASTTSTLPSPPSLSRALTAALVEGASKVEASSTASEPRSACSDRAARSARRRALRLTFTA